MVIGNSRYGETPLKNPANDTNAIAEQLRSMGFTVTLKLDATRQDMLETMQTFGINLGKQKGVGLFYFAGHGNFISGQQFFVPEYSIGKKWTTRYRFTMQNGEKRDVEVDLKVVSKEAITVPAGTFDAYKVKGSGFNYTTGSRLVYVYWIAPDKVRRPIVFQSVERTQSGRYFTTNRDELVAYHQSN